MILKIPSKNLQRSVQRLSSGFSLVELLLTLVLILCLAAASVFAFTTLSRSANLDEGLDRFQSLIRFAQAEAATTGRKVRLQFEPLSLGSTAPSATATSAETAETGSRGIRVTWEADQLGAPGVFQTHTNKAWSEEMVNELVVVEKVKAGSASQAMPGESGTGDGALEMTGAEEAFPSITFYPDGSCDGAEIVLASRNDDDQRRLSVRLDGLWVSISSRPVRAAEGEALPAEEAGDSAETAASQEFEDDWFEPSRPAGAGSSL